VSSALSNGREAARNGAPAPTPAPAPASEAPARITEQELAGMRRVYREAHRAKAAFDVAESLRAQYVLELEHKYGLERDVGEGITLKGDVVRAPR